MAETELGELVDTCCLYLDLQRRLLEQAAAARSVSPAVVIAMDAALEQLETAVLNVCDPDRLHLWGEPGEQQPGGA